MDPGHLGSESRDERAQGALAGGTQGPVACSRTLSLRVPWGTGQGHHSGPAVPYSPASPGAPGRSQGQRPFSWSQQAAPREGADVSWTHTQSWLQHPALPANPRVSLPRPCPPQEPGAFLALFPHPSFPPEPPHPKHGASGAQCRVCPQALPQRPHRRRSKRSSDRINSSSTEMAITVEKTRAVGTGRGDDEDRPPRGHSLISSHIARQPHPLWKPAQLPA